MKKIFNITFYTIVGLTTLILTITIITTIIYFLSYMETKDIASILGIALLLFCSSKLGRYICEKIKEK